MQIGEQVYLWRSISGGDRSRAGVIAKAAITGPIAEQSDNSASRPFWFECGDANDIIDRVTIHFTSADRRIAYDDLKHDPVLSEMHIIKAGIGTNFSLQAEQASRLASIWSKTGQSWGRTEIKSAIQAYSDGAKPEQLALDVGRTVSDARKKLASLRNLDPTSSYGAPTPLLSLEREIWDEFFDQR